MPVHRRSLAAVLLLTLAASVARTASAATYLPICDAELLQRSPVVVVAQVMGRAVRLQPLDGQLVPFTVARLAVLDILKGDVASPDLLLVLPGGDTDDRALRIPGTPGFVDGQRAVLFLAPRPGADSPT